MTEVTQVQRSDVLQNHARILDAARQTLVRGGPAFSMRRVAGLAGLSVATIHRHFAAREDLEAAVLQHAVRRCEDGLAAALEQRDVRVAIAAVVRDFARQQATNGELNDVLLHGDVPGLQLSATRARHAATVNGLVARARAGGVLAAGVGRTDFHLALRALTAIRARPGHAAEAAADRLARLLLNGLLADS